jgi:hypothetical protein
MRYKPISIRFF